MGTITDRKIGAVIGAAVADSAAQPVHWNYNLEKLDRILGDQDEIEFLTPSRNPYYVIPTGKQSCYGDQAYVLLQSLVACNGFDVKDFTQRTYAMFGPGTEYDSEITDNYVLKSGKPKVPNPGPWRHASLRYFNKQMAANKKDTGCPRDAQMDGLAKISPLVALYAGRQEMLEKAEDAIRVTQDDDITVTVALAYCRLLEHYILYGSDAGATEKVIADLLDAKRTHPQDLDRHMANMMRDVLPRVQNSHREVALQVYKNS